MNESPEAIARWLEQKRRTARAAAAVISVLAMGAGAAVFLVIALLTYTIFSAIGGGFVQLVSWLGLIALGLTAGFFAWAIKIWGGERQLALDPMGFWILKDVSSIGPRLILEGLRQIRLWGQLGEMNVAACAQALTYLAQQNAPVPWHDLVQHCPQLPWSRLKEQLSLLDAVLFLGEDAARVALMDPFRLRLRAMLEQDQRSAKRQGPTRPRPEPIPPAGSINEPEKLSAYEILGLSPSASAVEIKTAYRQRVKACHPDLFAGMDQRARASAERWTKALNAAYASLNPRQRTVTDRSARPR